MSFSIKNVDTLVISGIDAEAERTYRVNHQVVITPSSHKATEQEVIAVIRHLYPFLDIGVDCDGDVVAS